MRDDQTYGTTTRESAAGSNKREQPCPTRIIRYGGGRNRCAWTVRMLTTLIQGVEGGTWFRLFDKVFAERNLLAAFQQVARNDGARGWITSRHRSSNDSCQTQSGNWRIAQVGTIPTAVHQACSHPKPGTNETRPLGIPTVRDRVVQAAIVNVIEPIFDATLPAELWVPTGRGCKDALRRVDELLKAGYTHVVDADLKGYFDTIPHHRLMDRLKDEDRRWLRAVVDRIVTEGTHPGWSGGVDASCGGSAKSGPQSGGRRR